MKLSTTLFIGILHLGLYCSSQTTQNYQLVWSDEFAVDGPLDTSKWHHQVVPIVNGTDWANNEAQHYTARQDNSYVSNGTLKIVAKKENYTYNGSKKAYTSARLNTKFAFKYGRVDVRAKLPLEAGTWPAIWTLGANINETGNYFGSAYGSVGWPDCGEIDIMEQRGADKNNTIAHFHWRNANNQYQNEGGQLYVPTSTTAFHVYSLIWTEVSLKVMVDDNLVYELQNNTNNPYDNEHYILLNVAMGGNLGGAIPSNFSQAQMEIDYVRVYQNQALDRNKIPDVHELKIYPQPAQHFVTVESEEWLDRAEIFDLSGRLLLRKNLSLQKKQTLHWDLEKGIYLICITKKNGQLFTQKLMVE